MTPTRPEIVLVAAVGENGVIGADGDMPWRLPSDLKRFKRLTLGHPIVMGRKTFQSIGRPLPGRTNIVVTRDGGFSAAGIEVATSIAGALAAARAAALRDGAGAVMIVGGGEVYAATLAEADRLEITRVHAAPPGDTRFPAIDPAVWIETGRESPARNEADSDGITFLSYRRR